MKFTITDQQLSIPISQKTSIDQILQDLFLSKKTRYLLYQNALITVNGNIQKQNKSLQNGDLLMIQSVFPSESIPSYAHAIDILYEDDIFLVINKEPHMLVHSDGINTDHTVCNCVQYYFMQSQQTCPVRPLHRLDQETSGILLFCKYPLLQPLLDHWMESKQIQRSYLAVVEGKFPNKKQVYTDPIGRDRHDARRYITYPKGKPACTKAALLQYDERTNCSLIRCTLETGRTHQIRVHLSTHGYPLVNDPLYGRKKKRSGRLALHSATISLFHPLTQQMLTISCPLPKDLTQLMHLTKKGL